MSEAQAATQPEVAEAPEHVARPLEPNRVRGGDFIRVVYCATAFDDTKPEDLLKPEYWAHCAQTFKPWDRIEVVANDGTWWAEYQVMEAGRAWARMFMMRKHYLTTADVAQSQVQLTAYEVKHRGPHCKWSVVRKADKTVVHEFEDTRDGAEGWLKSHLAALAR